MTIKDTIDLMVAEAQAEVQRIIMDFVEGEEEDDGSEERRL